MTGYCATGDHANCPDSLNDTFSCSCPCHLVEGPVNEDRCVSQCVCTPQELHDSMACNPETCDLGVHW